MSVHDDEKKHQKCMDGLEKLFATDAIDLKGKQYLQVVDRVNLFRYHYGMAYAIDTEILADDGKRVLMVASVKDNDGRVVGKGYAEEIRNVGPINRTSAVENCETSAIGRALANIGLAGNEYASAFEMENIPNKEKAKASQEKAKVSQEKLKDSQKKVEAIKQELHPEDVKMIETTTKLLVDSIEGSSLDGLKENYALNKVVVESWKDKYSKFYERYTTQITSIILSHIDLETITTDDGLREHWASHKEMLKHWQNQCPEVYEDVEKAFKDKAKELKKANKESDSE